MPKKKGKDEREGKKETEKGKKWKKVKGETVESACIISEKYLCCL